MRLSSLSPRFMCFALLSLVTSSLAVASENQMRFMDVKPEMIRFEYQPLEGNPSSCTHGIENPMSGEWRVRCSDEHGTKEFSVHLRVRHLTRSQKPGMWFELLYWVTRSPSLHNKLPEFNGTSFTLFGRDQSGLHSFEIRQQVENGLANLALEFLPKKREPMPRPPFASF